MTKKVKEKAGVVAYRLSEGSEPHVLVVSARKFKNQWVFPVGTVEKGEPLDAAARRECEEESGYRVELQSPLPPFDLAGNGSTKRFTFFLATVIGEVPSWETDRQRKWLPVSSLVAALPEVFQKIARQAIERMGG